MVYLGSQPEIPQTTKEISAHTHVPTTYLSKVLGWLVRARLVQSQRGRHGGFLLARRAEEISALDVIESVDPLPKLERCPLGNPAHENHLCALHQRIADAQQLIENAFRASSLRDLLEPPGAGEPACGFPSRGAPGPIGPSQSPNHHPQQEDQS